MASRRIAATLECDDTPEFRYGGDGWFYIYDPTLGFALRRRPETFIRSFQGAAKALQEYYGLQMHDAEIIQLRAVP